jgi:hypothetical protein
MKTLFKELTAQLETIAELKWIDKDKGQMNFEKPPILFPAALVTLSLPNTQNDNRLQQSGEARIEVKLCFDWGGNTNHVTPEADRDNSLSYYDIMDAVFNKLQGWKSSEVTPLERRSLVPLQRPDHYTTEVMVFSSSFRETVS